MQDLRKLENDLWEAADQLRANSKLTAGEYSMPVLGLIFLRQATNRFYQVKAQIEPTLPSRGGVTRPLTSNDFVSRSALFLPEQARYDYLVNLPGKADVGQALVAAMTAIEEQSAMLAGALPKEYTRFDPNLLRHLLRIFNSDALRSATGDVFGRIYEYFLNKFAMTGAQEGGEYFTPPSIVRMIVNVIEPNQGTVLDCAVGSGGMFVQTGYFLEQQEKSPGQFVRFVGQEKNELTIRLARMNLAVHGLEGAIHEGNTFYDQLPDLIGNCDFVMANPPFNVDMVNPERVKSDPRLPFGIPGISQKTGTVSNANYLWIQYFYSYLKPTGRAGFVMASSATDAGFGEKRIRQELINTGHVDAIIAIGTNFFYTRSLPCTLWFFDKAKPAERQDTVLVIDARSIYRVVTRKIRDFSNEQLQNLAAIVWLHRGEQVRYLELVGKYLARTHELAAEVAMPLECMREPLTDLAQRLEVYAGILEAELTQKPAEANAVTAENVAALRRLIGEQQVAVAALHDECGSTLERIQEQAACAGSLDATALADSANLHQLHDRFVPLGEGLRSVQKHVNEAYKLTELALSNAEKVLGARRHSAWDNAGVRKTTDILTDERDRVVETIRQCLYIFAQATWLQSRFPTAEFTPVPGLCAAVPRNEIESHDSSLTPGRYVGVAPDNLEDDEEFEQRLEQIHIELSALDEESMQIAKLIQVNLAQLTI